MPETLFNLTFAGVPFCGDTSPVVQMGMETPEGQDPNSVPPRKHQVAAGLMEELDRIIPFQYLSDFAPIGDYKGRNLGSIAYLQNRNPTPKPSLPVGAWFYPSGACRWSVFRGLATSSMVKAMLAETQGIYARSLVMQSVPVVPGQLATAYYSLSSSLYMLPPRPLAEHGGKFDGLYLVTLVDERYYWPDSPVSLRVNQNTTWDELINQIAAALDVTINLPSPNPAYSQPEPDSQLWSNFESAAVLLDAIAYNLGSAVVRDLDGTYNLYNAGLSEIVTRINRGSVSRVVRTAGGDIFASGNLLPAGDLTKSRNSVVPYQVNVTFPKYIIGDDPVPHFSNPRYANQRPSAWFEESYGDVYSVSVPLSSGGPYVSGLSGTSEHSIRTTAKALCSGEAQAAYFQQPLNASGLTAMAMQIAQDYYNAQAAAALDEVYPGTFAWTPEGIHDIIWTYSDKARQATTRVMKTEWNASVADMQQASPALSGFTNTPGGVGGPGVAQSWSDSVTSGQTDAVLGATLSSGAMQITIGAADYLPTQNRWKGQIEGEKILFEGTSGGVVVGVVQRGIDGTIQKDHANGRPVVQITPDTTYGVNYVKTEKGQFVFPADWTSGGIQGVRIVPQTQTVQVTSDTPTALGGVDYFPGAVGLFDPQQSSGDLFEELEDVWVLERNANGLNSGSYYDGQLGGFSATPARPIYLVNTTPASDCGTVFLEDNDVRCESGNLNIYQRPVALFFESGCLAREYGDWVYLRKEGCCNCSGDVPPSGMLSGCTAGHCSGPCLIPPYQFIVPAAGFRGNCEPFNYNWILPSSAAKPCEFTNSYTAGSIGVTSEMSIEGNGNVRLSFFLGNSGNQHRADYSGIITSGNCCAPVTFINANCGCDDATSGGGGAGGCYLCHGATPSTWQFTVSGFTGDFASFNGTWSPALAGICRWTKTIGTATAAVTVSAGVFVLQFTDTATGAAARYQLNLSEISVDCCTPRQLPLALANGNGTAPYTIVMTPSCSDQSPSACPGTLQALPYCCSGIVSSGGGGGSSACCSGVILPGTLYATFTNGTGDCACFETLGTVAIYGGPTWTAPYFDPCEIDPPQPNAIDFTCAPIGYQLSTHFDGVASNKACNFLATRNEMLSTCSPFRQVFQCVESSCCNGTFTVTVTT